MYISKNEIARINFSGAVRLAMEELKIDPAQCAVDIATCYRDPPRIKDVINATFFLEKTLKDDEGSPRDKFFFPTCEAFGFDPDSFGFNGKVNLEKIRHYKAAKARIADAKRGVSHV